MPVTLPPQGHSQGHAVLRQLEIVAPGPVADSGAWLVVDVAGRSEGHFLDDTGALIQLTSAGAPSGGPTTSNWSDVLSNGVASGANSPSINSGQSLEFAGTFTLSLDRTDPGQASSIVFPDPFAATEEVVLKDLAQTLTTKTLTSPIIGTQITLDQTTADYTLTWADPAAARAISIDDPGGADSFAYLAATQTFTNKTITQPDFDSFTDWIGITPAPALSNAGEGRIYFDSVLNIFQKSENGGAYGNLGGGPGSDTTAFHNGAIDTFGADASIGIADAFDLIFEINGTEKMRLENSHAHLHIGDVDSGQIGAGNPAVEVVHSGTNTPLLAMTLWDNAASNRPVWFSSRARGSRAVPAAVVTNDDLFEIAVSGTNNTGGFAGAASIVCEVDAAPVAAGCPSRWIFNTRTSGAVLQEALRLDKDAKVLVRDFLGQITDTDTGLRWGADDVLRIDNGGVETARFVGTGRLLVGTSTAAFANPQVTVSGDGTQSFLITQVFSNVANSPGSFLGRRARGTEAVPLALLSGDSAFEWGDFHHDGTNFETASSVRFVADGNTPAGGAISRIEFLTRNGAVAQKELLRLDSLAQVIVNPGAVGANLVVENDLGTNLLLADTDAATNSGALTLGVGASEIGYFGVSPQVRNTGWSVTSHTTRKTYDAVTGTLAQLLDFVGTLVEEVIKPNGFIGA